MSFVAAVVPVVVDASFAIEALVGAPRFQSAWDGWLTEGAATFAPSHFWAELANALLRSVRLDAIDAATGFEIVAATGVETIDRGARGVRKAMDLAISRGLTMYDALYLELVLDLDARLATLDRALADAAEAEGIELVEI